MKMLPSSLLAMIFMALPALTAASPQPALVADEYIHLIPRHTLFFRQVTNLQTFNGSLGGIAASAITNSGDAKRPFLVEGDTFTDFESAAQRSCDKQANKCQEQANQAGNKGSVTVKDCDQQKQQCNDAQGKATVKDFSAAVASENIGPDPNPQFQDFDLICEV